MSLLISPGLAMSKVIYTIFIMMYVLRWSLFDNREDFLNAMLGTYIYIKTIWVYCCDFILMKIEKTFSKPRRRKVLRTITVS